MRKFSSTKARNCATEASAGCSVTVPVRARLAASRATPTAISTRSPRIASRNPSRARLCSSNNSAHSADSRARSASSPIGITGCAASARSRAKASPARSVSAPAASSVKLKHPAVGDVGLEAETVRDGRRHQDRGRRRERQVRHIERHLAAALFDQQDLKQIAMAMGADGPVVDRRPRGDGFDVNKIERLIVRRIAVQMEQWQRRSHGGSEAEDGRQTTETEREQKRGSCSVYKSSASASASDFTPSYKGGRDRPAPARRGRAAPLRRRRTARCARPPP